MFYINKKDYDELYLSIFSNKLAYFVENFR